LEKVEEVEEMWRRWRGGGGVLGEVEGWRRRVGGGGGGNSERSVVTWRRLPGSFQAAYITCHEARYAM